MKTARPKKRKPKRKPVQNAVVAGQSANAAPLPQSNPIAAGMDPQRRLGPGVSLAPKTRQGPTVEAHGRILTLSGKTRASFSHSYEPLNIRQRRGRDCETCGDSDCVRANGRVRITYQPEDD